MDRSIILNSVEIEHVCKYGVLQKVMSCESRINVNEILQVYEKKCMSVNSCIVGLRIIVNDIIVFGVNRNLKYVLVYLSKL